MESSWIEEQRGKESPDLKRRETYKTLEPPDESNFLTWSFWNTKVESR